MSAFARLMHRQRLEEVAQRFALFFDEPVSSDRLHLPFSALESVRVEGRPLSSAVAARRAHEAGLRVEGDAIHFDVNGVAVERDEDALLRFLGGLVEADPAAFFTAPPPGVHVPEDGKLPRSAAYLERFYGGQFVPREKKSIVVDLQRSQGPWMRSIDPEPIQIIDAASQIASLPAGFRPGPVQSALDEGRFDPHLLAAHDSELPGTPAYDEARAYACELMGFAAPWLRYVTYTNGGSEANEKALDLARRNGPGGRRIIAFEGSFHGRTLLPLFATWSPEKRARYQLEGYGVEFVAYPAADEPYANPLLPVGWRGHWADLDADRERFRGDGDPLLRAEVESLIAVEQQILKGDLLAVLVEPYQCEGGDNTATRRFYHGLRSLTRAHGVPLILDEVQAGFGLSGSFLWQRNFWFLDAEGRPDGPDLVTGAKRAQVGVVLSRWPDPRPSQAHGASLARGRVHLGLVHPPLLLEDHVERKLDELVECWPDIVSRPRVYGDAFAIDFPSASIVKHLIAQRFYQGYMVYPAGARTLRYRLNRAMTAADVDVIFEIIDRSISALVAQAGGLGEHDLVKRMDACVAPAWSAPPPHPPRRSRVPTLSALLANPRPEVADLVLRVQGEVTDADRAASAAFLRLPEDARGLNAIAALRAADPKDFEAAVGLPLLNFAADVLGTRIRRLTPAGFDQLIEAIVALETDAYEAARRDEVTYLRSVAGSDGGIVLVAEDPRGLVGMSFAGPLELWWGVDGPRQDAHLGRENTLYSADVTVARRARGRGIGLRLRERQMREAMAARRPDGTRRYAFITGRNRVEAADAMWAVNQRVGAYTVAIYSGQYGDATGQARYYRIPLRRWDRRGVVSVRVAPAPALDFAQGVNAPTGAAHPVVVRGLELGAFDEAALTKLTVSNFITPAYARYAEALRVVAPPGMSHMYFTSGNDEMVDKSLRSLRHQRGQASIAVSFDGGYAGHTTAAARSLSDPASAVADGPFGYFDWPRLPHPNAPETIAALDALIATHGVEKLLGVYVEAVQARTGRVLQPEAWARLCGWRDRTGVPLVLIETTTGFGRTGTGRWYAERLEGHADLVLWWAGGQIGHVFAHDRVFVSEPLQLISTWDGDELSATRLLWQLYATREVDTAPAIRALDTVLADVDLPSEGLGLYRILRLEPSRADRLLTRLAERGVRLGRPPLAEPGALLVAPPVTVSTAEIERFGEALRAALVDA